jgi:hypothetical protein
MRLPFPLWKCSKEDISTHILLRLTPSMQPIGTIRGYLVPGKTDTYKLTRLAIIKEYRKYGFGRKLVEALHQWIKSHAAQSSTMHTQLDNSPPDPQILSKTNPVSVCGQKYCWSGANSFKKFSNQQSHSSITVVSHSQIYAKGFYTR